ncbi:hypothetical protein [Rhodopseudomonas sp. B29]|uniref:hypothetical protein n=1 Tax=Rhodopseudomonas sp. B29 TaxID=95607 RepID=UPI0003B7ADDC|nr:hypothetical protein [Rhodopseudomonas sp. B29]
MSSKQALSTQWAGAGFLAGAFSVALLVSLPAKAQTYKWKEVEPHFEVLRDAAYKTPSGADIKFTAIRFHLGYFRLKLASTQETLAAGRDVKDGIARFKVNGEPKAELLSYSLEGTLNHLKEKPTALAPAGWATNQRNPAQIALLRINGRTIYKPTSLPSFSAVLCLNDIDYYKDYDAIVPVVFTSNDITNLNPRAAKCKDAVQLGPRIVEEGGKRGITESELRTEKYQRVIFFVDDPLRDDKLPARSREAGRNGYILLTHNKVHLFDLQTMLLDKPIYAGGRAHWAVNLAGDDHTGLLINTPPEPELIENTLATVGSVLIVERRD